MNNEPFAMSSPGTAQPFTGAGPDKNAKPGVPRAEGYHAWLVLFFTAKLATLALLATGHPFWALAIFLLPAPWYARQIMYPAARGLGPVITNFKTERREVWLTIDDGPDPASTPAILDLLDTHQTRATFFLIGEKVLRHPALVSEILRRGHTIGNHTHTHPYHWFWCGTARMTAVEIDNCAAALRAAGAGNTRLFRPPVGLKNHPLHAELGKRGLDLVLWSARGFDTTHCKPAKVLSRIADRLEPGAIVLVHENKTNPDIQNQVLTGLLAHLAREGYRCTIPPAETLIR